MNPALSAAVEEQLSALRTARDFHEHKMVALRAEADEHEAKFNAAKASIADIEEAML